MMLQHCLTDRYDIGGEGACLKRYTDPSFFKTDSACSTVLQEGIQNERRPLKAMVINDIKRVVVTSLYVV